MRARFGEHPLDWWMERILELGGLAMPVESTEAALDDDQVRHIGMSVMVDVPGIGPVRQIGVPFVMSATPGRVGGAPPAAGADNAAGWSSSPVGSVAGAAASTRARRRRAGRGRQRAIASWRSE